MVEFTCKRCGTLIVAVTAEAPPEDGLCAGCAVIVAQADPQVRRDFARLMDLPRADGKQD